MVTIKMLQKSIRFSVTISMIFTMFAFSVRKSTCDGIYHTKNCTEQWYCRFESNSTDELDPSLYQYLNNIRIAEDLSIDGPAFKFYQNNATANAHVVFDPCDVHFKRNNNFLGEQRDILFPEDGGRTPLNRSYYSFQECMDAYCQEFHRNISSKILRCNKNFTEVIDWETLELDTTIEDACNENIKFLNLKGIKFSKILAGSFGTLKPYRTDFTGFEPNNMEDMEIEELHISDWLDLTESPKVLNFIEVLAKSSQRFHIIRTDANYYFYLQADLIEIHNRRAKCLVIYKAKDFTTDFDDCAKKGVHEIGNQQVHPLEFETYWNSRCEIAKKTRTTLAPPPSSPPINDDRKRETNDQERTNEPETNYERLTNGDPEKIDPAVNFTEQSTPKINVSKLSAKEPEVVDSEFFFKGFVVGVTGIFVLLVVLKFLRR